MGRRSMAPQQRHPDVGTGQDYRADPVILSVYCITWEVLRSYSRRPLPGMPAGTVEVGSIRNPAENRRFETSFLGPDLQLPRHAVPVRNPAELLAKGVRPQRHKDSAALR